MKQFLSILIFLSFLVCSTNAQEIQRPESYNYKQGVEALQNNDLEKALEFLNKELQEHKDNLRMARCHQELFRRVWKSFDSCELINQVYPQRGFCIQSLGFQYQG